MGKSNSRWLTCNFVYRSFVNDQHIEVFSRLVEKTSFYYLIPALDGDGDLDHIILPKYGFRIKGRR